MPYHSIFFEGIFLHYWYVYFNRNFGCRDSVLGHRVQGLGERLKAAGERERVKGIWDIGYRV
jgi:hypothetical protein